MPCSKLNENQRFFIGTCMSPTIETGAKISFEETPSSEIHIGDIILFEINDRVLCHRVVGKYALGGRDFYLEKGDKERSSRLRSLSSEQILGKVISIETNDKLLLPASELGITRARYCVLCILSSIIKWLHQIKLCLFGNARPRVLRYVRPILFRFLDAVI